ncbi:hypothetical protein Tco_1199937 [Tanacetum coccineum]
MRRDSSSHSYYHIPCYINDIDQFTIVSQGSCHELKGGLSVLLSLSGVEDGKTVADRELEVGAYGLESIVGVANHRGTTTTTCTDVHPDELCPPNKRYDLMYANKKVDLDHMQFLAYFEGRQIKAYFEGRQIKALQLLHPYHGFNLTLDDFRTIFHLPQATDNNYNSFVPPPSFSEMVPFYKQVLGFIIELKTPSSFKTTGLLQPWQTLCKIFSKYLTTRVTGWDQLPLQIMQMLYCFVNNIHVDYAELL